MLRRRRVGCKGNSVIWAGEAPCSDALGDIGIMNSFKVVEFPKTLYMTAAISSLKVLKSGLSTTSAKDRGFIGEPFLATVLGAKMLAGLEDSILKDMHDGYVEAPFKGSTLEHVFNIGATGESVERLFVYLELARSLNIPATLSRGKYSSLRSLQRLLAKAVRSVLQSQVETRSPTGLTKVQEIVAKQALRGSRVVVPPLPGHILQTASKRGLSLN